MHSFDSYIASFMCSCPVERDPITGQFLEHQTICRDRKQKRCINTPVFTVFVFSRSTFIKQGSTRVGVVGCANRSNNFQLFDCGLDFQSKQIEVDGLVQQNKLPLLGLVSILVQEHHEGIGCRGGLAFAKQPLGLTMGCLERRATVALLS